MRDDLDVLREEERLRGRLSLLRRRLLEELSEPGSATTLAARLGETRQKINYHLREMEKGGLVELVELRQRRGRTERVLRASARSVVIAPTVIGDARRDGQDRFAADALLSAAARTFNDVAELRERADAAGKRLVTFTVDTEIAFAEPADIERFTQRLADRLADLAAEFHSPASGRRYRVVIGGHPVRGRAENPQEPAP
ncbi:ArsR/SmtB family transcription factor [Spirillospora sp. CA-294931]|uniref:ArsR/SmtB family transcription factor n=1 Tax=Spirillospora sp. CA-294931 TaxID=3240042 RepID=UPI003D8A32AB